MITKTLPRYLRLLKGYSWQAAQTYAKTLWQEWTLVNTLTDYNQNKWLGVELGHTLVYFNEQTPLNHLLSILGCIRGGSVILMACPDQQAFQSHYFFSSVLLPSLQTIQNYQQLDERKVLSQPDPTEADRVYLSSLDESIVARLTAKQDFPVHLVGPRGTGKSTLIGCAIARMLARKQRVLLCTPSRKSAENAMKRLTEVSRETFALATPCQLLTQVVAYDRIVIDEAATLPRGVLQQVIGLAKKENKTLILTTTTEGYEGTGQSYRLSHLTADDCQVIYLTEPKRFATDKLYQLALSLAQPAVIPCELAEGVYVMTTQQLIKQQLVEACYVLLREAHYKTTPNDLVRFYNNQAVYVVSVKNNRLIGAVRCQHEAIQADITAKAVYHGRRRCKNALTQQALIQAYDDQYNIESTKILRVERIATLAAYRRQGIASQMIEQVKRYAKKQGYDFLSTSFSASQPNYSFWKNQAFKPLRIGLYQNKWLNQHALLMLFALHPQAQQQQDCLSIDYANHLDYFKKIYPNWLVVEKDKAKHYTVTREQLQASIISVVDNYRDINWLLPELNQYEKQVESPLPTTLQALLNGQLIKKSAWATAKADLLQFQQTLKSETFNDN